MKKLLNILTSFSLISTCGFNLIACDFKNDNTKSNDTVTIEKSNLEKAKDFLSKGVTISDALPGKTIKDYINHIKYTNSIEISSDINFIFDDNYEETTISEQQETDVMILLQDGEINEPVQFKLKLSDRTSIINNILEKAKRKITENSIVGIGLLATTTISEDIKSRIVKLIEEKIDSNYVQVDWFDQSILTSLVIEEENKGKVTLSIVDVDDEILKSETVDFTIINVLDSEKTVNQQLIEDAMSKIQKIDVLQKNITENIKLNDTVFKATMKELISNMIDDERIEINLIEEDITLKQKENKLSVKLSTGNGDNLFEKEEVISLLNVLTSEKEKNNAILIQLKDELSSIDGSNLNANLLIIDSKIWDRIKQKVKEIVGDDNYSKIQVSTPFSLPSLSTATQQVFNNVNKKRNSGNSRSSTTTGQKGVTSTTGQKGVSTTTGQKGATSTTGQKGVTSTTGQRGATSITGQKGATSTTGQKGATSTTGQATTEGTNLQTLLDPNRWSKTATLATTNHMITALIKVGSGKDKVQDLILVRFTNVIA